MTTEFITADGMGQETNSVETLFQIALDATKKDMAESGGYVYPGNYDLGQQTIQWTGVTLRDHFAGLAMAAIISKTPVTDNMAGRNSKTDAAAWGAYDYADSMLAARK